MKWAEFAAFVIATITNVVFYMASDNLNQQLRAERSKPAPIITPVQFSVGQKVCGAVQSELKHIQGREMVCANGRVFWSAKQ